MAQAFVLALSEAEGPVLLALSAFFTVALIFQARPLRPHATTGSARSAFPSDFLSRKPEPLLKSSFPSAEGAPEISPVRKRWVGPPTKKIRSAVGATHSSPTPQLTTCNRRVLHPWFERVGLGFLMFFNSPTLNFQPPPLLNPAPPPIRMASRHSKRFPHQFTRHVTPCNFTFSYLINILRR